MAKRKIKKAVLAYSGGLDTSIILKWLQDEYECEVVTFTADLGQGEEVEPARQKALDMGIKEENIFILDLREEFVKDFVFPMFRANAIYEGEYLLGTSIARPLISKKQIEIAHKTGADAVSHGATGKGNDQVRFELGYLALDPDIAVIAPWREWDLNSRTKLLKYAADHGIDIDGKGKPKPYSMDANLLHISYEGEHLENPYAEPEEDMWLWSVSPEKAPDEPEYITISYKNGDPVAINREEMSPATILKTLNDYGNKHGIGRIDIVENRYVGMKARGCYETPGGTIMLKAHRAIESITLDREEAHMKDELMPKYAKLIYQGFWWSAERKMLQAAIDATQEHVQGDVKLKLYKGNVTVVGRRSDISLYSEEHSTFEEDEVYNQKDAEGFIRLNALRFIIEGKKQPERIASMIKNDEVEEVEECRIETGSFTICQRIKRFFGFGKKEESKEEYIKKN
ncbi:argininosuccinate synthase [Sulfurovum sp. TSL6]|uniref:argininosuccinate synthase n=1 Tax=Sulfurovum sp. TSL6 TaxID=2826995 RepID=UPI001CC6CF92|nr:argininosuccinate synthase [Sulfurovum sp. TSL6]GIU00608.1 argininosuccinate synthase [Sulfurovum sp. TSL6]